MAIWCCVILGAALAVAVYCALILAARCNENDAAKRRMEELKKHHTEEEPK